MYTGTYGRCFVSDILYNIAITNGDPLKRGSFVTPEQTRLEYQTQLQQLAGRQCSFHRGTWTLSGPIILGISGSDYTIIP